MLSVEPLPYAYNALEPYYNEETLKIHHDILYKGYVDNTNKTEESLRVARNTDDFSNIKCLSKNLSFFGSGAILHKLFFENITPETNKNADTRLLQQFTIDFGGYEKFKKQFNAAAANVEASGWCILAYVPEFNKLEILQCEKHQDLTLWGCIPLLVLDVWEHSYFLQYKTKKDDYINAWWNIVNWDVVSKRFENINSVNNLWGK